MNRQQALNQLRLMQAWHEDLGNGPNADYDAICYAIGVIEEMPAGTDSISRKQAIDAFLTELTKRERKNLLHTWSTVEVKYFVVDMLEKLPPAQPEQRTGKCMWCERLKERNLRIEYYWIDEEGCTASFSEPHIVATGIAKFCPNCGAKMEGGAE